MNWKPLQLPASAADRVPAFLISTDFATDSYAIYLTNLTDTWTEQLGKSDIIKLSREENTSIDPSEDEDQMRIFLEKLESGLNGAKDSTLALHIGSGGRFAPALRLDVKVSLPGGMKDLEWAFNLELQSQRETAEKLLLPTLGSLRENKREVEELFEILKEKDMVIQKLVDKLEESGNDLGTVFHQVAVRPGRKVDRKKANERVKGLGVFDAEEWRKGIKSADAVDLPTLLNDVYGSADTLGLQTRNYTVSLQGEENWWKKMAGETINLSESKSKSDTILEQDEENEDSTPPEEPEEDDFQVQATPPHLSKANNNDPMDESTDDEDDLDAPSQRSQIPSSIPISQPRAPSPSPKSPPKKLGGLGKKRKAPTPTPPTLDKDSTPPRKLGKLSTRRNPPSPAPPSQNNDDTTTDDEPTPSLGSKAMNDDNDNDNDTTDDDTPPPKRQKTPQESPTTPPPKKKGRLGQIGKKTISPAPPSRSPSPSATPSASPSPKPTTTQPPKGRIGKIGKIGRIGNRKKEATPEPEPEDLPERLATPASASKRRIGGIGRHSGSPAVEERGRVREEKREKTPPPRETSTERADRKRDELKKELEAKSKAPVKKKRKF